MKLSVLNFLVFGEDLARNTIHVRAGLSSFLQEAPCRDYFEGSRVYSLEILKQLQILFLLNVRLLTDKLGLFLL